ncbi:MAG: asparagine synthase (glutamine-hydrolyzing) [Hyphomicrobiales bacterium]|nr:asparagine synthase (glutamine-hydrolyzing) [Hyphomicrobiales bacterium]
MCGIAGYIGPGDSLSSSRKLIQQMIGVIAHRGPDEQDIYCDREIALGHARLSIIDPAGGKQPMSNADKTVWLIFNGEIFNHVEIRQDLTLRGHVFRTKSDTEVILNLYLEKGEECVNDLNGDFSFAIWDSRRKKLVLARDRMGVRPLFYTELGGRLTFASEVKSLLKVPGINAELDPIALDQIFSFWFPLAPRTPFKGVFELPPGHMLVATPGGKHIRPYWSLAFPDADDHGSWDQRSEKTIAEECRELLFDATRIRLRSDVPVGAYLSGGLDSSIITAAVKHISPRNLRTFSVTFKSEEFDEREFQQEMVQALDTRHEEVLCDAADIARMFPKVIHHTEQPVLRTAPAPLFALSDLVHQKGYKVVLTGEGADEVFAGYDIFKEAKLRRFCARQPHSKYRPMLFQRLYPYLPRLQNQSHTTLAAFFNSAHDSLDDPLFSHLPRFRSTRGTRNFLSSDMREKLAGYDALGEMRESLPADFTRWHPLSQAQYLETVFLLPGYILSSQGDRMSMAHAVEGRYPFLDHRLVEFASRIPPAMKIRGMCEKHILRESMKGLLPTNIRQRPKQPYRAPESDCFTGRSAPSYVESELSMSKIDACGYFHSTAVEKLTNKRRLRSTLSMRDNMAFVGILSTQLWHREFVEATQTSAINQPHRAVA